MKYIVTSEKKTGPNQVDVMAFDITPFDDNCLTVYRKAMEEGLDYDLVPVRGSQSIPVNPSVCWVLYSAKEWTHRPKGRAIYVSFEEGQEECQRIHLETRDNAAWLVPCRFPS